MRRIHCFILLTLLLCLGSCGLKSTDQQQVKPIYVETLTIAEQKQINAHSYVGKMEESASIPVSSPIGGTVTELYVSNGEQVKEGQVLLVIDSIQAYNSWQIALATLQQATDGFQRAQQVFEQGGVTEQKMVELRSQLQQAQSMLAIARKRLDDCTITAPRDGIVAECDLQIGQNIAPAVPIITLLDIQEYKVAFDVPEKDISTISIGDQGNMSIEALQVSNIPIRVTEKNLIANRLSHTYTVTATLTHAAASVKRQLLPGMVGKIQLHTQAVEGIIIPATCIHTQTHSTVVWVVDNGKAMRRQIEVGPYTADGVLVTSGLSIGDIIITSGYQKMYNGAPVTY